MKYFIKVTLYGLISCCLSAFTIGIGYGAVYFMKEALHDYGIKAIVLFLFSLLLFAITILLLFIIAIETYVLVEKAEDSINITTEDMRENKKK